MNNSRNTKSITLISMLVLFAFACQTVTDVISTTFAPEAGQGHPTLEDYADIVTQTAQAYQAQPTKTPRPLVDPVPTLASQGSPVITEGDTAALGLQQETLSAIYDNVSPGVVALLVATEFGGGSGSGFVIDNQGHIVTNYHVVADAIEIQVNFPSGIKTRAEVIGLDTDSDLAIVKVDIDPQYLHPVPLGDSSAMRVGDFVVAIGNPFGLNGTMTIGIVSSLGRSLTSLNEAPGGGGSFFSAGDIIQTDAAINPGNSGGPLLNLQGEVIGINRAIRTYSATEDNAPVNSGIGFAVSVNILKRVAPSLIEYGYYNYPYLGISSYDEIPLQQAERLGLELAIGALVTRVSPGGPAAAAGLLVDDVIVKIDDAEVKQFPDLIAYLFTETSPGDVVIFKIFRNGEFIELELTIGARP